MSLIKYGDTVSKFPYAYMLSVLMMSAISSLFLQKNRKAPLAFKGALSACISFIVATSLIKLRKECFFDEVSLYFAAEDRKSILTLHGAKISSIEVSQKCDVRSSNIYTMCAVLDKLLVCPGTTNKAERRIKLNHYHHAAEENVHKELTPQMVFSFTGKKFTRTTEICLANSNDTRSFFLDVQSKKYVEYTPISGDTYVAKAMAMQIGKKSFISILLERYILLETSSTSANKAIFLLRNFSHLLPKQTLLLLKRKEQQLYKKHSRKNHQDCLKNSLSPFHHLELRTTKRGQFSLPENCFKSLNMDILELLKERALRYDTLHEILKQDTCKKTLVIQEEEIVACYPDKTHLHTSTFFKKHISTDRILCKKMQDVHGYLDDCKSNYNAKVNDIMFSDSTSSTENAHVYETLSMLHKELKQEVSSEISLGHLIEYARKKVAHKYCYMFRDDICGLVEKTLVHLDSLAVTVEKSRNRYQVTEILHIPQAHTKATA